MEFLGLRVFILKRIQNSILPLLSTICANIFRAKVNGSRTSRVWLKKFQMYMSNSLKTKHKAGRGDLSTHRSLRSICIYVCYIFGPSPTYRPVIDFHRIWFQTNVFRSMQLLYKSQHIETRRLKNQN